MTPEQLEQLAELITQKIIDEFDRRIAEKIQPMTPDEFFHHQVDAFGNIKQIAEGVKNKIFKKADVEQIADIRWLECSICPALDVVGKT